MMQKFFNLGPSVGLYKAVNTGKHKQKKWLKAQLRGSSRYKVAVYFVCYRKPGLYWRYLIQARTVCFPKPLYIKPTMLPL